MLQWYNRCDYGYWLQTKHEQKPQWKVLISPLQCSISLKSSGAACAYDRSRTIWMINTSRYFSLSFFKVNDSTKVFLHLFQRMQCSLCSAWVKVAKFAKLWHTQEGNTLKTKHAAYCKVTQQKSNLQLKFLLLKVN